MCVCVCVSRPSTGCSKSMLLQKWEQIRKKLKYQSTVTSAAAAAAAASTARKQSEVRRPPWQTTAKNVCVCVVASQCRVTLFCTFTFRLLYWADFFNLKFAQQKCVCVICLAEESSALYWQVIDFHLKCPSFFLNVLWMLLLPHCLFASFTLIDLTAALS